MKPDLEETIFSISALLIIVLLFWAALTILPAAQAYDEREQTQDWCYSHVSGQSMPMDYCQ